MSSGVSERAVDVLLGSASHDGTALVDGTTTVSHTALRTLVAERSAALDLPDRSLVVARLEPDLASVVTYLALLDAGHVPLLAGDHADTLVTAWDPAAVVVDGELHRRRTSSTAPLHPDLALLLSTSGSTGSPKLVRLSHRNVASNARAIADYLALGPGDRAITTLPLHYCYGLSVLHSHLAAGAGVVLTSASVVDPCFADAVRDHDVTGVAGVPHTYELLERVGADAVHGPALRTLTQAGGRLAPDVLARWRRRAERWGVDLLVMYGQTEATARMAYLPPALAGRHPGAIGRAIPGGELSLRAVPDAPDGVGELVYRGPNVMLGYATEAADLALGATVDDLATGDLARHHADDDVYELVGRRARFVKPFGLRIDLDAVAALLAADGLDAVVTGDDDGIVVCVPAADATAATASATARTGLPPRAIAVVTGPPPRTASGKVDHARLLGAARAVEPPTAAPLEASVADVFATVLGRDDVAATSTFVSLGGDSLNYIECSLRLEELVGRLPADWQLRSVAELDALERRHGRPRLDTTVLLRAAGILAIVSTHMVLWDFPGGAHLMLAVVGYNVSRFHLPIAERRARLVAMSRSVARVCVPVVAFVGAWMLLVGGYSWPTLGLVNNYLGPPTHRQGRWHYWFVEAIAQIMVVLAVVLAWRPAARAERRFPYVFPLALLVGALVLREQWTRLDGVDNLRFQTHGVLWFFLLGWLVHRSTTTPLKLLTSAICVLAIPGFFAETARGWFIAVGLVLLVWCPRLPIPRLVGMVLGLVAAASMAIFITHFRVFPVALRHLPIGWAYAATVAVGIATWLAVELGRRAGLRAWRHVRRPATSVTAERRVGLALAGAPVD